MVAHVVQGAAPQLVLFKAARSVQTWRRLGKDGAHRHGEIDGFQFCLRKFPPLDGREGSRQRGPNSESTTRLARRRINLPPLERAPSRSGVPTMIGDDWRQREEWKIGSKSKKIGGY